MKTVMPVFILSEEATSTDGCAINGEQLPIFTLMFLMFMWFIIYVAVHMVTGMLISYYSEDGVKICIKRVVSALAYIQT